MPESLTLSRAQIKEILRGLLQKWAVVAPKTNGAALDYLPVQNAEEVVWGDDLPYKSPKELFFPRNEKIITFAGGEARDEMRAEKTALFGARPCDLEALAILEKVLTQGKFKDPYFEARREKTLLIGIACVQKKPGCFCDERETDLSYSERCDLFLGRTAERTGSANDPDGDSAERAEDAERFEVLYVSEKGRKVFAPFITELDRFENKPHPFAPERTLSIDATEDDLFNRIDWESLTETCQGCGMCTFICPTCHCFMFKDVDEGDRACRYRNWDSCMFPKFTLHASGHNPRAAKHERYRQRVSHKYLYIKENFGVTACTGCGRCVRGCPTGMDIRAVVGAIAEELK